VEKEFGAMIQSEIVEIIPLRSHREPLFPAVWAMRRKRRVLTREIYKWKARMNLDGSKQREGIDDQTFAPVATWESIRLLLGMVLKNKWKLSNSTTFWRSRKLQ
jgi:hypothetical protein